MLFRSNDTATTEIYTTTDTLSLHDALPILGARQLPQELPHALAVLVRATFLYPEPSFTYNAGEPNISSAISPGELASDLLPPERLQG